jgi:sigma-B regulation protein RsbU (phosphoserine phosphatase)
MNIALFADPTRMQATMAKLEARGHACMPSRGSIPGEADCLLVIGDAGEDEGLVEEAERAGLPVLRLPEEGAAEAAEAAAWGLGLADERYIDAARSDARVKRLEDIRVKMAEQRTVELSSANELLEKRASELNDALVRLDGANRQLMDELNLASELQKSLLPRSYPGDAPLEFAHKFIPLNSIGGDFFDVVRIDRRTLAMVIADVSGHGVGPALVTAMFKSSFGIVSKVITSPAALMSALNADMNAFLATGHYVTAFAAFIDLETLEMRYCSAGHPNQLLLRADGSSEELATMGFLLGMIEGMDYEEKTAVLAPGDTLILFTDGVFESLDEGGKPFGREGIIRSVGTRPGAGPGELSAGLFTDLLAWSQGTEAEDDITILMAQVIESL